MNLIDVQIDRLVGPTHHFGGLGVGNLASAQHAGDVSTPKAAALEGLDKMQRVASLGVPQCVLPPQERPCRDWLREFGFEGSVRQVLQSAYREAPEVLSAAMSCSAMWTANAGTVIPAVDSQAEMTAVTVANLNASLHRSIEPSQTTEDLRAILPASIRVMSAIPGGAAMRDEGAANHMRLAFGDGPAIHVLVYGDESPLPKKHWPRQTLAACRAIARRHQLRDENTFFIKQHPDAIDAGAFHNDVVAMSHEHLWIHHERAYLDAGEIERIEKRAHERVSKQGGQKLLRIEIPESVLSLDDAVGTYLLNSQVLSVPSVDQSFEQEAHQGFVMLCPRQVQQHPAALALVHRWCDEGIFSEVQFVDLHQSMAGGGGPACLRLRVPMTADQVESLPASSRLTEPKADQLRGVIEDHYPDRLTLSDLTDPDVVEQATQAVEALRRVLLSFP